MASHSKTIQLFAEQVQRLSSAALGLLFPSRCVVCRRVGDLLCESCAAAFKPLAGDLCPVCSQPVNGSGLCVRCTHQPPAFAHVSSAFHYRDGMRKAILAFKYRGMRSLAEPLASVALTRLPPPGLPDVALCPVPMHPERLAARGYNHAELLAEVFAEAWQVPLLPPEALTRVRETPRQVGLDFEARLENVRGVFAAEKPLVAGRNILLVDDVCTTGATMHSCAAILTAAGVQSVQGVTLARTT